MAGVGSGRVDRGGSGVLSLMAIVGSGAGADGWTEMVGIGRTGGGEGSTEMVGMFGMLLFAGAAGRSVGKLMVGIGTNG